MAGHRPPAHRSVPPFRFRARLPGMQHHEVIVIGAGVAGIYQIKRLVDLGIDATVLEAGGDLGGTWQWNCRGAFRFELHLRLLLLARASGEWHWKGASRPARAAPQPRRRQVGLRSFAQFNCGSRRHCDEAQNLWRLHVDDGRTGSGRDLTAASRIHALGLLSIPTCRLAGAEGSRGRSFHASIGRTSPSSGGQARRRVGTGATGIR
jgi:cation diffusion facilitator CzcD-associated flavoprotein CzcO